MQYLKLLPRISDQMPTNTSKEQNIFQETPTDAISAAVQLLKVKGEMTASEDDRRIINEKIASLKNSRSKLSYDDARSLLELLGPELLYYNKQNNIVSERISFAAQLLRDSSLLIDFSDQESVQNKIAAQKSVQLQKYGNGTIINPTKLENAIKTERNKLSDDNAIKGILDEETHKEAILLNSQAKEAADKLRDSTKEMVVIALATAFASPFLPALVTCLLACFTVGKAITLAPAVWEAISTGMDKYSFDKASGVSIDTKKIDDFAKAATLLLDNTSKDHQSRKFTDLVHEVEPGNIRMDQLPSAAKTTEYSR